MKTKALKFLLLFVLCLISSNAIGKEWVDFQGLLTKKIPLRQYFAMTGSEFAKYIFKMDDTQREQAILDQFIEGNVPDFLRKLKPVSLTQRYEDGKSFIATIFAMPDYLAIGSNRDFIRMPMNLYTAIHIADKFGFTLPTRKIVDAISSQSAFHLTPEPMHPSPQMRSTAYYLAHNQKIKEQMKDLRALLGELISGHKKDVVISSRLVQKRGKIAIYGWHRPSGDPIQPLSTIHSAAYADYSHGIRLISRMALLNGEPCPVFEILEDPVLANVLSDEGSIRGVQQLMDLHQGQPWRPAQASSILDTRHPSIKNQF